MLKVQARQWESTGLWDWSGPKGQVTSYGELYSSRWAEPKVSVEAVASGSSMNTAEKGKIHGILRRICLWGRKNCEAENYKKNEGEETESLRVEWERAIRFQSKFQNTASAGRRATLEKLFTFPCPSYTSSVNVDVNGTQPRVLPRIKWKTAVRVKALEAQKTWTTTRSAPKFDSLPSS